MSLQRLAFLTTLAATSALFIADDARACGGCFVPPTESTVVSGHRMALSLSMDRTVLWDQIEYQGNPEEFSWVLPVKPGATLEVASPSFFEVLEAGTANAIGEPQQFCGGDDMGYYDDGGGFGCGSSDYAALEAAGGGDYREPPPPVTVVSQGTVGPYETVTLSADDPAALNTWLDEHGYSVPADVQPIIDDYVAEGFDFIALRLIPGEQVSAMQPVRVTTPGSSFTLPLRMVAAGTGATTALTLFVLGEGRYEAQNFGNGSIASEDLVWDFKTSSSNYSELRSQFFADRPEGAWLTSYALQGALFGSVMDNLTMGASNLTYQVGDTSYSTLAEAYVQQAIANGEDVNLSCVETLSWLGSGDYEVVADCKGLDCPPKSGATVDASSLACGAADDLAAGLVGMHTGSLWITRLDAELPRAALAQDLVLEATDLQEEVQHRVVPFKTENECGGTTSVQGASLIQPRRRGLPGGLVPITLGALGVGWWLRRRKSELELV